MESTIYCSICDRRVRVLATLDGKCSACLSQQRALADRFPRLFELREQVRRGANPEWASDG